MKKLLSLIMCCAMVFSLSSTAFAAETDSAPLTTNDPIRIERTALDAVRGSTPAMTEVQATEAVALIEELADNEQSNNTPMTRGSNGEAAARSARINTIESELEAMGAIPLTIEDIYQIHGLAYHPGAPDVPGNTNYVKFYGLTSYITKSGTQYEVYSIVGYSAGASQSVLNVPMYTEGVATIYNEKKYVQNDFSKYLGMASTVGGAIFEDAFDNVPILNYLSTVWDVATYFNPSATQKVTVEYDGQQTFVYSYVAEVSGGYFNFMQTTERIAGTCLIAFRRYLNATPKLESVQGLEYEVKSPYYADYSHAVDLYRASSLQAGYSVGTIQFKLNNTVADSFSMTYYNSIWNIPGV